MKKFIVDIVILVLIFSIAAGCGEKVEIPDGEPIIREEYSTETPTDAPAVWGVVNTDRLNVRKEPYMDAQVFRQLSVGTRIEILEQKILDGVPWGRIEAGWVNLKYVDLLD
jgi:hypothetical protein